MTAISLSGVGKRYIKYEDTPMLSAVATRLWTRTQRSWLWALRDVDLDVEPGESVGILGRNGAGKSTLLAMLCGVTAPSTGRVRVVGRIAPLISVGVGFHPEMTGRENVYVNGTILGLTRRQIDQRFDAIVAFAELESFIDTPVKFYSSGMFVRLGFAVAVEAEPDVLLVDEVLAVGDLPFQIRCFDRMNEIRQRGTTVVLVTHNLSAVRTFCDRGVVLKHGRVVFDGETTAAVGAYHEVLASTGDDNPNEEAPEPDALRVVSTQLLDASEEPVSHLEAGTEAVLRVVVEAQRDIRAPFLAVRIDTSTGLTAYSDVSLRQPFPALRAGERATYDARLSARLATGSYVVDASVRRRTDVAGRTVLLARCPQLRFFVAGREFVHGIADLDGRFESGPA